MMIIQTSLGKTCMSPIVWLWTWQFWDSKPDYFIIFTHLHGYEKANWIQFNYKKIQFNLIWFEFSSIWIKFNQIMKKKIQFDLIWIQFNQIQFNWI